LDFPEYKHWNPFVRSQEIYSPGNDDQTIEVGKQLHLTVNIPPTFEDSKAKTQKSKCIIEVIDHKNYSAEWRADMLPSMLLRSYRVQRLREEEQPDGKVTIYESKEVFAGLLMRIVQWSFGKGLQEGFEAMAEGLRKRSEELALDIS